MLNQEISVQLYFCVSIQLIEGEQRIYASVN